MAYFWQTTMAATRDRVRRQDAAHQSTVVATIEHALATENLDSGTVAALADRKQFQMAVAALAALVGERIDRDVATLFVARCSDRVRLFRFGQYFRLWSRLFPPAALTVADLRADKRTGARMTLAACGELAWSGAGRRERAALLLHVVARRCRGGAS